MEAAQGGWLPGGFSGSSAPQPKGRANGGNEGRLGSRSARSLDPPPRMPATKRRSDLSAFYINDPAGILSCFPWGKKQNKTKHLTCHSILREPPSCRGTLSKLFTGPSTLAGTELPGARLRSYALSPRSTLHLRTRNVFKLSGPYVRRSAR